MKALSQRITVCFLSLFAAVGCASVKVSDQQPGAVGALPRPARVLVYDFTVRPSDLPAESVLAGASVPASVPQTEEEVALGRKLGDEVATRLVGEILAMGMPAEVATPGSTPGLNDIVVRGHLLSIVEGSEGKRVMLGFGAGATELKTAVEVYQMTAQGLRRLGGEDLDATGGKAPGEAAGLAMTLATHNPLGLIVNTVATVHGERSGSRKIEGRANQTAKEIAEALGKQFRAQGWIK